MRSLSRFQNSSKRSLLAASICDEGRPIMLVLWSTISLRYFDNRILPIWLTWEYSNKERRFASTQFDVLSHIYSPGITPSICYMNMSNTFLSNAHLNSNSKLVISVCLKDFLNPLAKNFLEASAMRIANFGEKTTTGEPLMIIYIRRLLRAICGSIAFVNGVGFDKFIQISVFVRFSYPGPARPQRREMLMSGDWFLIQK